MHVRENIKTLLPYVPGKPIEELERELGLKEIVKLASNENPLGASPKGLEAAKNALTGIHLYPDGSGYHLTGAIAERHGVARPQVVLGNGSNEVIEIAARTFLAPGDEAIYSRHAFIVYPLICKAIGATGVEVPPLPSLGHDLEGIAAAVTSKTRFIFLANPNNPTGTMFPQSAWKKFLDKVPVDIPILVDEAYAEYVTDPDYPDPWKELAAGRNLIITRTFSKIFGLAGLRIGYAVSTLEISDLMNRVRPPFNANTVAQAAALAALSDEDFVRRSREVNVRGLRYLRAHLEKLGLKVTPSWGNFILADLGRPAGPVYEALLGKGVIARPVGVYGLPNHLRITVGTQEEIETLVKALSAVLGTGA